MRNWLKHIPRDWMLDQDGANAGEGGDQGEQELEDIELGTSGKKNLIFKADPACRIDSKSSRLLCLN